MPNLKLPLTTFHFIVNWGGVRIGFTEVTGLDIQTEVISYREGSSPDYQYIKMPGMKRNGNITLKRGLVKGDNDFFNWYNTILLNNVERRDITISLLNEKHEPAVTWRVRNAFPVKVSGPELKAGANEIAIETLEITHEGLTIENA